MMAGNARQAGVWIRNLRSALERFPVVVLHGNVRDRYISDSGQVYDNLTPLLTALVRQLDGMSFSEVSFFDPVGKERSNGGTAQSATTQDKDAEFAATAPATGRAAAEAPPTRVLAQWCRQLADPARSKFAVIYYLDKLVSYKASYAPDEQELLLHLEKIIENISETSRLVVVALQDTLVPVELYRNAPKVRVMAVPTPGRHDRRAYLEHCLGESCAHLDLLADLTDGFFLRDLDSLARDVAAADGVSGREVRELVNKYRVGERVDHWGALDITKLDRALTWFKDEEGVKGQDEAIGKVRDVLLLARSGLTGIAAGSGAKPRGILFFAGPTGVGKTLVAKKLAKFLFSTEDAFLRFDMSEFKEEHTVSKLIGSPPGYVGSDRGGVLTNAVRERPFSVILFDEIEKAHPKIMDIFLQLLDDGRLTDSRGQTVFFTETVVVFTSNLGTRSGDSRGQEIGEKASLDEILADKKIDEQARAQGVRRHFERAVRRFFEVEISRPELLNRIGDNIVPFNVIQSAEIQEEIVRSNLARIAAEFSERYRAAGYQLEVETHVPALLVAAAGRDLKAFGARGITSLIESTVMVPLARSVLAAEMNGERGRIFWIERADDVAGAPRGPVAVRRASGRG